MKTWILGKGWLFQIDVSNWSFGVSWTGRHWSVVFFLFGPFILLWDRK